VFGCGRKTRKIVGSEWSWLRGSETLEIVGGAGESKALPTIYGSFILTGDSGRPNELGLLLAKEDSPFDHVMLEFTSASSLGLRIAIAIAFIITYHSKVFRVHLLQLSLYFSPL
jgi:hypothetical protein